jgi:hypothetical protein
VPEAENTGTEGLETGAWKQRTQDLSWREMDDQAIILDLRSASYLRLNGSALTLWERLEDAATLAELATTLSQRFDVTAEVANRDATEFLTAALSAGLVERV